MTESLANTDSAAFSAPVKTDEKTGGCPLNRWPEPHCECPRTDHPQFPDGRCHRTGDGAEQMTSGKVHSSPALCLPCLFACTEDDE